MLSVPVSLFNVWWFAQLFAFGTDYLNQRFLIALQSPPSFFISGYYLSLVSYLVSSLSLPDDWLTEWEGLFFNLLRCMFRNVEKTHTHRGL